MEFLIFDFGFLILDELKFEVEKGGTTNRIPHYGKGKPDPGRGLPICRKDRAICARTAGN
jgi:hypothetical protein